MSVHKHKQVVKSVNHKEFIKFVAPILTKNFFNSYFNLSNFMLQANMSNINRPLRIQTQHRRICKWPMNGSNRFYQDQTSLDMLPLTVVTVAVAVWDQPPPHLWLRVFALRDSIHKVHQIYLVSLKCFAEFKSKVEITQNFVAFSEYLNFNGFHKLFEMMEHILLLQNANFDLFFWLSH